jgi:hypothetical protein
VPGLGELEVGSCLLGRADLVTDHAVQGHRDILAAQHAGQGGDVAVVARRPGDGHGDHHAELVAQLHDVAQGRGEWGEVAGGLPVWDVQFDQLGAAVQSQGHAGGAIEGVEDLQGAQQGFGVDGGGVVVGPVCSTMPM